MIKQKAISLKIDTDVLRMVDAEAALGYEKRNRIINNAIRAYIYIKDAKRRIKLNKSDYHRQKMYEEVISILLQ